MYSLILSDSSSVVLKLASCERLDARLLVHRNDDGILRMVEIEPDDLVFWYSFWYTSYLLYYDFLSIQVSLKVKNCGKGGSRLVPIIV
jgi:hypothetical protein